MTSSSFAARAPMERPSTAGGWLAALGWAGFAMLAAAQIFGFTTSPPDRDMGDLQKIMYVHVPAAWNAFIAFFVVFAGSVLYLWRRAERYDLVAASAAEVAAVLTGLTLALGSIWGRPTWGVWWTWDARLTSTAVLEVLIVGYLALRGYIEDPDRRATWSAVVGILAAINVPIVYMSVRWWRTLHQLQSSPSTVDPAYARALQVNAIAFLVLTVYFILKRYHAALAERTAEARLDEQMS